MSHVTEIPILQSGRVFTDDKGYKLSAERPCQDDGEAVSVLREGLKMSQCLTKGFYSFIIITHYLHE